MIKKSISPTSLLISAILVTILGFLVLFNPLYLESIITWMIPLFSVGVGVLSIINYIFNRNENNLKSLLSGISYIFLGIFIRHRMKIIQLSIVVIIGFYAFINFMAQFVSMLILYKNKVKLWIFSAVTTITSLIFSAILIFHPIKSMPLLLKISGIYLILFGLTIFNDFIREVLDVDKIGNDLKRRVRIRLPIIYTAFVPQNLLEKINIALATKDEIVFENEKSDKDGELEVFIHLGEECANGFGHVDICYKDTIYCYGSYDNSSKRLFESISDAVLIEVNRDKYIEYTTKTRCVVSFVLSLNSIQCESVENKIKELKKPCEIWQCNAQLNPNKNYNDYASLLYIATDAKYYKFKYGYFKTYFVLITNCVKLADTIIGATGMDIIGINGIITPGIYYNFLNNLFNKKNTIVIRKNIYNIHD